MAIAGRKMDSIAIILAWLGISTVTQKHSGGFLARGRIPMVGERGAVCLSCSDSPAQELGEQRTEQ